MTSSKIVNGSIGVVDVDLTQIQRRVVGACAAGGAVQAVDPNGDVTCQPVGTGTVTTVDTAGGLTGGPIVGSGTVSIADGGVDGAKILDNSVSSADIANGSITNADIQDGTVNSDDLGVNSVASAEVLDGSIGAADVNSAAVQLRVTGTCNAGISGAGQ